MASGLPLVAPCYVPETYPRRVLLVNPPVYDTRFPWARFHQPVSLLQLSTYLRRLGCDIRLLDALPTDPSVAPRRRMRIITRDDLTVNYWRFGRLPSELTSELASLKQEGWQPDEIYIEGFTTFWWEGVVEAIALVRKHFPDAQVVLYGAYPRLAQDHAEKHSGEDILVVDYIEGLTGLPLDLSLYPSPPGFTYLSIGTTLRSPSDLVDEFLTKVAPSQSEKRVWSIAFADHDVVRRFPEHFRAVLLASFEHKCKVSFYALGNLYPSDLVEDSELATLLFRAGFKQLAFADDRHLPLSQEARESLLTEYIYAVERCVAAGYRWRTDSLSASVCLGRPGEDPGEVVAFMSKLAHTVGSLIVVPYQPVPAECTETLSLELQNGKLFPFAQDNSLNFRGYQDILGLAAMLNAKYRSCTFDFLGDGIVSRLVRQSLVTQSWNPKDSPGSDRPITIGWFNKEGKWVRS